MEEPSTSRWALILATHLAIKVEPAARKRCELRGAIFGLSCGCEAPENVTPAGRDKAVSHYGQRKLVGPILIGK
jgi:hypothetical protein